MTVFDIEINVWTVDKHPDHAAIPQSDRSYQRSLRGTLPRVARVHIRPSTHQTRDHVHLVPAHCQTQETGSSVQSVDTDQVLSEETLHCLNISQLNTCHHSLEVRVPSLACKLRENDF